jgi:hypothetical protein
VGRTPNLPASLRDVHGPQRASLRPPVSKGSGYRRAASPATISTAALRIITAPAMAQSVVTVAARQ